MKSTYRVEKIEDELYMYWVSRRDNKLFPPFWSYPLPGHVGNLRLAISKVEGVEEGSHVANQGMYNSRVELVFKGDTALEERKSMVKLVWAEYCKLNQAQADTRKANVGKPKAVKPAPTPRVKKPAKPMKKFLIFPDPEDIFNENIPHPKKEMEGTSLYRAKEAYDEWYSKEYNVTISPFELKGKEIK